MSDDLFSKTHLLHPPVTCRPWTRWWWPGGAVERDELLREIRLFADMMFGGVEIQAFTSGINPQTLADPVSPVYDYDSPAYYDKLLAVIEEAKHNDLRVDLTIGSGWPPGGPSVPLEDNTDTLVYGEMTVTQAVNMPVPPPIMPFAYAIFSPDSILGLLRGREWTQTLEYRPEEAQLVAVVAAKITDNQRSPDPSVLTDTLFLDLASTMDITAHVKEGHLQWEPPESGEWQVIAIYTMPSGSHTLISAVHGQRYVVDPFDSGAIVRFYENWIGQHEDILAHAGETLRALFSDSYEYFAQRFFADDLLDTFAANRGYDVKPYLPAVFHPAKDQHFFFFTGLQTAPDFSYGDLSERIIHDYNLTVSDLFFKHWYAASRTWIEGKNLRFRQQGYNPPLDIIKAAGAASIPETEGTNPLWLKRVASGGHLYGRPIISAESFVFMPQGGYALTPQDYKQGIDLLMTAGVNQVIYHGTPYQWDEPGYGETGWSPFISPYGSNISSNISEADAFWPYQREVNTYAARLQMLLQQGQPDADIMVYLPVFDDPDDERFRPVVSTLDACGLAWEWVNDDILQQAAWTETGLQAGSMIFKGLVIPDCAALPLETAEHVLTLVHAGLPMVIYGQLASRQPGFHHYAENDKAVAEAMAALVDHAQVVHASHIESLTDALLQLDRGVVSYALNPSLCFIRRRLDDGTFIAFIRNTSAEDTKVKLQLDEGLTLAYWLQATSGKVCQAQAPYDVWLPSYGSIVLIASQQALFNEDDLSSDCVVQKPVAEQTIDLMDWSLQVVGNDVPDGKFDLVASALGDWSQIDDLKYCSSVGHYETKLDIEPIEAGKRYMLDLGAVHSAADVSVNGEKVGAVIFSPYQIDITDNLATGENTISVDVTPALKNRLLGKALSGDPEYRQFADGVFGPAAPIPSGWVGPAALLIY